MTTKKTYYYGTGKRKASIARGKIFNTNGKIQVNDRDREEGFFLVSFKAQDEDDGWFSFLNFQDVPNSGLALGSDADFKIIVSTEDSSTKITAEVINSSAGDPESLLSKINELLS